MNLTGLEQRVAASLYECLYGDLVSNASRGAAASHWLTARIAGSGFEVACGVRLALLVVLIAPLWFLPGWRTFLGRDAEGKNAALAKLAEANSYAMRQLFIMLKALFALFAGHDAAFSSRVRGGALVSLGRGA